MDKFELTFFKLNNGPVPLEAGAPDRPFMDATPSSFAYRCTPLQVANAAGWEYLCPADFEAVWDGGPYADSVKITGLKEGDHFVSSHFGAGTITFHSGWLPITSPGVQMWAMGSPNHLKDGIQPLAGIIETHWTPMPFTMNWRFTRIGHPIQFKKDEPFCFMTPTWLGPLKDCQPVIVDVGSYAPMQHQSSGWMQSRHAFVQALRAGDPTAVEQQWQKNYRNGVHPEGVNAQTPEEHYPNFRLPDPTPASAPTVTPPFVDFDRWVERLQAKAPIQADAPTATGLPLLPSTPGCPMHTGRPVLTPSIDVEPAK